MDALDIQGAGLSPDVRESNYERRVTQAVRDIVRGDIEVAPAVRKAIEQQAALRAKDGVNPEDCETIRLVVATVMSIHP